MKIQVTSLYSYEFIAKETEPLSSSEEINLLIQESSQKDSETVKPKKEEKTAYDKQIVAPESNVLQESLESDRKVVKPKQKKKPPMINESSVSDDKVKDKENLLDNELHDIVVET